ncbi:MAG: HNH endonuclease [Tissierellia bacterium]|nr:HNH endonuclease [Tissierellia bacterium]
MEDAPPKSLGGKANTLTCKTCNSKCGHEIDFHLTERLLEIDTSVLIALCQLDINL